MTFKILAIIIGLAFIQDASQKKVMLVPNEETAVKIAEAIWLPIYGEDIYDSKPYQVISVNDSIWHVFGTLPAPKIKASQNGDTLITAYTGGVPHIKMSKFNACIIEVFHTK